MHKSSEHFSACSSKNYIMNLMLAESNTLFASLQFRFNPQELFLLKTNFFSIKNDQTLFPYKRP